MLIAEDEPIIAMMMEDAIEQIGGHVINVVASCSDALQAIASGPISLIVLDFNLAGGTSEAVLAAADGNGIPVLVSSGSDPRDLPEPFRNRPVLPKPWTTEIAQKALIATSSAAAVIRSNQQDSHSSWQKQPESS